MTTQSSLFTYLTDSDQADKKPRTSVIAETRTRMQFAGPDTLTDVDLLSLIISGEADGIWNKYQSLSAIVHAPWQEITLLTGVGQAAACRIKAALELGKRLLREDHNQRIQFHSPAAAAEFMMAEMQNLEQEHLTVLLLDTKNHLMTAPITIYIGNVNTSVIRISEVLRSAIRWNATAFVAVHNHPSGDPTPSPEDIEVTKRLAEAGRMVDVELLDHIIIGCNRYASLKEKGVTF